MQKGSTADRIIDYATRYRDMHKRSKREDITSEERERIISRLAHLQRKMNKALDQLPRI